jgi:hypothetical protein
VRRADLGDLRIEDLMEFEYNYYAIAEDPQTGVGAMELLLDKATGTVGPEIGPNMMWNDAYGMHRHMAANGSGDNGLANRVSPEEAVSIAGEWLAQHRPTEEPEAAPDAFYGYYTLHTVDDAGNVVGMVSVHGETGQVWYHSWHGEFVGVASAGGTEH